MSGLVLASASSVRARVLAGAGLDFEIQAADIDEDAVKKQFLAEGKDAQAIAAALAAEKALAISRQRPADWVVGADQVLELGSELISKSADMAAAERLLRALRGRTHRLICAVVLVKETKVLWSHAVISTLTVRAFGEPFLASYLADEGQEILASVGCYRLEGRGVQLFERIEGDYFSILGLPLLPLLAALREQGALQR